MKVLIACEESQAVCKEFRRLGHEAYSCDILPCSGGHPKWHIQTDVLTVLQGGTFVTQSGRVVTVEKWDFIISFQPCTDTAVSGARWFPLKRADGSQEKSIRFFFEVWKYSDCSENPVGILNGGKYIKKWFPYLYREMLDYGFPFMPTQTIQPWQFGHGETKATCLWLKMQPLLKPTHIVSGREQRIWKLPPTPDRSILRSKTFPGIARAMAEQWGRPIQNQNN
jgi:hypothetical protein